MIRSIFIFAGEPSGDVLGANLMAELKKKQPDLQFEGVGGSAMIKEGLQIIIKMQEFQVMGFSDVLKALFRLLKHLKTLRNIILEKKPKAVILIDYAEFNLKMAKSLRKKGYQGKIIHYVSPSVWAWRKGRAKAMAKNLDLLLSILPFEEKFYEKSGLNVCYVGHPLVYLIKKHHYDSNFELKEGTIALFPGSRPSEILLNLPIQIESAKDHSIAISCAHEDLTPLIQKICPNAKLVPHEKRYDLMKHAKAAIATCGTVTLELALHHTPTLVTYKLTSLNFMIAKFLRIKLRFYNLANIITNEPIFPEFVHKTLSINEIQKSLDGLLVEKQKVMSQCKKVSQLLTDLNASQKAAEKVLELLEC